MAAPSIEASGTQTAVIGTEHTLVTITTPGFYELHVDTAAMLAGDTVELRLKEKILSGGTSRVLAKTTVTGAAAEPEIKVLGPYGFDQETLATLKQTAGIGRAFPWKALRVG